MTLDANKLIQDLIAAEFSYSRKRSEPGYRPVVTVSRDFGAGGGEIARRLAARLGVEFMDRHVIDAVSEAAHVNPELMAELDEKIRTRKDSWIYNLLSGQNAFLAAYRHHLVNVVLAVAQRGGVLLGRGAHIILANREVFRLRVVGSELKCAKRIAAREQIEVEAARSRVRQVNKERDDFLHDLLKHRLNEAESFDLVLNTDKLNDWDAGVELILEAMRDMGFKLPEETHV